MLKGQRVLEDDEDVRAVSSDRGKSIREIARAMQLVGSERDSKRASRACRLAPGKCERGVCGVAENGALRHDRQCFLQNLQALCTELGIENRKPGHVPAGVSEAGDEPA